MSWQNEKKEKIKKTEDMLKTQEKQTCTFKPIKADQFKELPKVGRNQLAMTMDDGWTTTNGIQKHLVRQFIARQTRAENEQLKLRHSPLQKWKNEKTNTKEFKFLLNGRGDSSNYLFAGLNWKSEGDILYNRGDGSSNYLQTMPTDFPVRLFKITDNKCNYDSQIDEFEEFEQE